MATVDLPPEPYRHLVRLLAESAGILTIEQRQSLLDLAGLRAFRTRLTFDTDARTFAAQLVRVLQDHGTLQETGQPALVSLLALVREIVAGNEGEAAFLDALLAPYGLPERNEGTAASGPTLPPATHPTINYYQTIYQTGSGTVTQGLGATTLGAGAVHIGGDARGSQIVTGNNNTVAGGDVQGGTIRVGKIEGAEKVTVGTSIEGELPPAALALARAFLQGTVSVEEILNSQDVTVGLRYVANPQQPTLAELRAEMAALREQIEAARAADDLPADVASDATGDLDSAGAEAGKEKPDGGRIVRKLKSAAEVLDSLNKAGEASRSLTKKVVAFAPTAATLLALAKALFGL